MPDAVVPTCKDYLAPLEASIASPPTNLVTGRIKALDAFASEEFALVSGERVKGRPAMNKNLSKPLKKRLCHLTQPRRELLFIEGLRLRLLHRHFDSLGGGQYCRFSFVDIFGGVNRSNSQRETCSVRIHGIGY